MSWDKTERQYYLSHGVCPVCRRNDIIDKHCMCPDCLAKTRVRSAKYRKNKGQKYIQRARDLRKERREAGLCTLCGEKLPDGYTGAMCLDCREHERIRQWKMRDHRPEGTCRICDAEALPGRGVCEKHYNELCERLAAGRAKYKAENNQGVNNVRR